MGIRAETGAKVVPELGCENLSQPLCPHNLIGRESFWRSYESVRGLRFLRTKGVRGLTFRWPALRRRAPAGLPTATSDRLLPTSTADGDRSPASRQWDRRKTRRRPWWPRASSLLVRARRCDSPARRSASARTRRRAVSCGVRPRPACALHAGRASMLAERAPGRQAAWSRLERGRRAERDSPSRWRTARFTACRTGSPSSAASVASCSLPTTTRTSSKPAARNLPDGPADERLAAERQEELWRPHPCRSACR